METIRLVVETFIRLVRAEIDPGAVLAASDDIFEVTDVPSLVLQGPMLTENMARRTQSRLIDKDVPSLTYEERKHPRLYHLDFDVVATTASTPELVDLQEKIARFYQVHPVLEMGEQGVLNLTESVPLGGLRRVNLSDLRQSSGRLRIEDCPIYDGLVDIGKLIKDRVFEFVDGVEETRVFTPED